MQQPEAHRMTRGAKSPAAADASPARAHLLGDGPVALSGLARIHVLSLNLRSLLLALLLVLPGCGPPT